jgi:hypothetical protein
VRAREAIKSGSQHRGGADRKFHVDGVAGSCEIRVPADGAKAYFLAAERYGHHQARAIHNALEGGNPPIENEYHPISSRWYR